MTDKSMIRIQSTGRSIATAGRSIAAVCLFVALSLTTAQVSAQFQQRDRFSPQPNQSFIPNSIPAIPASAVNPNSREFESVEEAAEQVATPWWGVQMPAVVSKVAEGGWLMIPLAICSLIVLTLSLERMVALRRGRVIPRPFVRRFTECVEDGQLSHEEATEICEDFDCPVSEVFRAALRRWGRPMFEIEQAVMDAGDRVSDGLRRYLRVFHAISNVAPLMGLLGTVIGMIEAFEVISSQESLGRPEMLASGISKALMTTAAGLCVAIPAYLAYMYFSGKSDRYMNEIDRLCQRVVDCISAEGLEDAGAQRNRKRRAA
jgi:biopolymer transport protein ExbB